MMNFNKGTLLDLDQDLAVENMYLRWDEPSCMRDVLLAGRYIVAEMSHEEVLLAEADWTPTGKVTFHSTKHGALLKGKEKVEVLKKAAKIFSKK